MRERRSPILRLALSCNGAAKNTRFYHRPGARKQKRVGLTLSNRDACVVSLLEQRLLGKIRRVIFSSENDPYNSTQSTKL